MELNQKLGADGDIMFFYSEVCDNFGHALTLSEIKKNGNLANFFIFCAPKKVSMHGQHHFFTKVVKSWPYESIMWCLFERFSVNKHIGAKILKLQNMA